MKNSSFLELYKRINDAGNIPNHAHKLRPLWHEFVQEVHGTFGTTRDLHNFLENADQDPKKAAQLLSTVHDVQVDVADVGKYLYIFLLPTAQKWGAFAKALGRGGSVQANIFYLNDTSEKERRLRRLRFAMEYVHSKILKMKNVDTLQDVVKFMRNNMQPNGDPKDLRKKIFRAINGYAPLLGLNENGDRNLKLPVMHQCVLEQVLLKLEPIVSDAAQNGAFMPGVTYKVCQENVLSCIDWCVSTSNPESVAEVKRSAQQSDDARTDRIDRGGSDLQRSPTTNSNQKGGKQIPAVSPLPSTPPRKSSRLRSNQAGASPSAQYASNESKLEGSSSLSNVQQSPHSESATKESSSRKRCRCVEVAYMKDKALARKGESDENSSDEESDIDSVEEDSLGDVESTRGKKQKLGNSKAAPAKKNPTAAVGKKNSISQFKNKGGSLDWKRVLPLHFDTNEKNVEIICNEALPTRLMYAVAKAYPKVTKFLNDNQLPLDVFFHAGRKARKTLGLDPVPKLQEVMGKAFEANCTPLLTKSKREKVEKCLVNGQPFLVVAPMVQDIRDAHSLDFKREYLNVLNELPFVSENKGAQHKTAPVYRCSFLAESKEDPRPVMKHGLHATVGVSAVKEEAALMQMQTEFSLLLNDATREEMWKLLKMPRPHGYIPWREHYAKVAEKVQELQSCSLSHKRKISLLGELNEMERTDVFTKGVLEEHNETIQKQQDSSKTNQSGRKRKVAAEESLSEPPMAHETLDFDDVVPTTINLQLTKIGQGRGGAHGPHADNSAIFNSPSHKEHHHHADGQRLPTPAEMAVVTTCLCSDGYPGWARLKHLESNANGETVSDLAIEDNHSHAQSPGCQNGWWLHLAVYENGCKGQPQESQLGRMAVRKATVSSILDGLAPSAEEKQDRETMWDTETESESETETETMAMEVDGTNLFRRPVNGKWQELFRVVITSRNCALPARHLQDYSRGVHLDIGTNEVIAERIQKGAIYNKYNQFNVLWIGSKRRTKTGRKEIIAKPAATINFESSASTESQPNLQEQLNHPPQFVKMQEQARVHTHTVNLEEVLPNTISGTVTGIPKPEKYANMRITRAAVAMHSKVVGRALMDNRLLEIALPGGKGNKLKILRPMFLLEGNPLAPLHVLSVADTGLKKVTRMKTYLDPQDPKILTLEQPYKSIPCTVDVAYHYFHRLTEWLRKSKEDRMAHSEEGKALEQDAKELCIITHGTGGSSNPPGNKTPSGASASPFDCHHTTGAPQAPTEDINAALLWLNQHERPIAVLFNKATFFHHRREVDEEKLKKSFPEEAMRKRVLAANEFVNSQVGADGGHTGYINLGYWKSESLEFSPKESISDVVRAFKTIPDYLKGNHSNTSFLLEKPFRVKLTLAFHHETNCKLIENFALNGEGMAKEFEVVGVDHSDLSVMTKLDEVKFHTYSSLSTEEKADVASTCQAPRDLVRVPAGASRRPQPQSTLGNCATVDHSVDTDDPSNASIPIPLLPTSWVDTSNMLTYISSLPKEKFDKVLGVSKKAKLSEDDKRYKIPSLEGLLALIMSMTVAAAARSNPKRCVCTTTKNGKTNKHVVPLCWPTTDELPSPHRLTAMPVPNGDFDVGNVFFFANAVKLDQALCRQRKGPKGTKFKFNDSNNQCEPGSYSAMDFRKENNVHFVKNLIFMSTMLRMTGEVNHMRMFGKHVKEAGKGEWANIDLPTLETRHLFVPFMRRFSNAKFSDFVSGQHARLVPSKFTDKNNGIDNFSRFVNVFGKRTKDDVKDLSLDRLMESFLGGDNCRHQMVELLAKELADSTGTKVDKKFVWLAHKIVADVEMVVHNAFGEVTYESLGFGHGSDFGRQVFVRGRKTPRHKKDQFVQMHSEIEKELLKLDEVKLQACGHQKIGNCIVSSVTGREFSFTDTEHIMCKIYICAISVHPSRTSSNSKEKSSSHCWPMCEPHQGMEAVQEEFEKIWTSFEENKSNLRNHIKDNCPPDFDYQVTYFVDPHDVAHLFEKDDSPSSLAENMHCNLIVRGGKSSRACSSLEAEEEIAQDHTDPIPGISKQPRFPCMETDLEDEGEQSDKESGDEQSRFPCMERESEDECIVSL